MHPLTHLFANNRAWVAEVTRRQPDFFERSAKGQAPQALWIGCADSRVPANLIVGLGPGELFVHRNIANVAAPSDVNCLAVLQYAVDALRVGHVIICGHYGCGGVLAALRDDMSGPLDEWLHPVREVRRKHQVELDAFPTEPERHRRLCELNVAEQARNVSQTSIVRDAWARGQELAVHGWIYELHDGLLRDLGVCLTSETDASRAAHGDKRE